MRLIARTVYRAFPELDNFSDKQCKRLVKAARGGIVRRIFGLAFRIALTLGTGVACALASAWAEHHRPFAPGPWSYVFGGGAIIVSLVLMGTAWLLWRDVALRLAVRRVLRRSGTCPACYYQLTGLPLAGGDILTCPECGYSLSVRAHGGEGLKGTDGVDRFMPSPDFVVRRPSRWTRRRIRIAGAIVLVTVGPPGALWGAYELFLRVQAGEANAHRMTQAELEAIFEEQQPDGVPAGAGNAWDQIRQAGDAMWAAERSWIAHGVPFSASTTDILELALHQARVHPEVLAVGCDDVSALLQAELFLDAIRERGVIDRLNEMTRCARAVPNCAPYEADGPMMVMDFPGLPGGTGNELTAVFWLLRIGNLRMRLSLERGERAEFCGALEANLGLLRSLQGIPQTWAHTSAAAMMKRMMPEILDAIARSPDAAWLDGIEGAFHRQHREGRPSSVFHAQLALSQDALAWYFASPARVRFGTLPPELATRYTGRGYPGTFQAQWTELERAGAAMVDQVDREPSERSLPMWNGGVLTQSSLREPFDARSLSLLDELSARWRGLEVAISLQRFRLAHGDYPGTLQELVPHFMTVLPKDPWASGTLQYRPLPKDDLGRPRYLLYSIGPNGRDDHGELDTWDILLMPDWMHAP